MITSTRKSIVTPTLLFFVENNFLYTLAVCHFLIYASSLFHAMEHCPFPISSIVAQCASWQILQTLYKVLTLISKIIVLFFPGIVRKLPINGYPI